MGVSVSASSLAPPSVPRHSVCARSNTARFPSTPPTRPAPKQPPRNHTTPHAVCISGAYGRADPTTGLAQCSPCPAYSPMSPEGSVSIRNCTGCGANREPSEDMATCGECSGVKGEGREREGEGDDSSFFSTASHDLAFLFTRAKTLNAAAPNTNTNAAQSSSAPACPASASRPPAPPPPSTRPWTI